MSIPSRGRFLYDVRPVPLEEEPKHDVSKLTNNKDSSTITPYTLLDKTKTPISRLPPELLNHIFKFITERGDLYKTIYVCKYWFKLTIDALWLRPNLVKDKPLLELSNLLSKPVSSLTVPYHLMIKRLNLSSVTNALTDEILLNFTVCTQLERLTLIGCQEITDESLVPFFASCHNILSVDLTNVFKITDKSIISLASNCKKLQGIYATACKELTDDSIVCLAESCPSIKRLKLTSCSNITDYSVQKIIQNCTSLVELDLADCNKISDATAAMAFIRLPQLREFRLAFDMNISDSAILSLPPSAFYDKLRLMDLTSCSLITDDSIERLISVAPRLRHLVLAKCVNITDLSLNAITKLGRNLHYLHLGHCSNITNRGISSLVKACNRIEYIDVASCTQLTDQGVQDLATLPKLRRVGLVKCQNISDNSILSFAHRTGPDNTLERIHLSYCSSITTHSITALVNACDRLTHLSLSGVPAFLKDEFTRYCRDPPPDFNEHQQRSFCVFSSTGVKGLREQLNKMREIQLQEQSRLEAAGILDRPPNNNNNNVSSVWNSLTRDIAAFDGQRNASAFTIPERIDLATVPIRFRGMQNQIRQVHNYPLELNTFRSLLTQLIMHVGINEVTALHMATNSVDSIYSAPTITIINLNLCLDVFYTCLSMLQYPAFIGIRFTLIISQVMNHTMNLLTTLFASRGVVEPDQVEDIQEQIINNAITFARTNISESVLIQQFTALHNMMVQNVAQLQQMTPAVRTQLQQPQQAQIVTDRNDEEGDAVMTEVGNNNNNNNHNNDNGDNNNNNNNNNDDVMITDGIGLTNNTNQGNGRTGIEGSAWNRTTDGPSGGPVIGLAYPNNGAARRRQSAANGYTDLALSDQPALD